MTNFIDNQRRILKSLTWLLVCRFYLEKSESGKWCIKHTAWWLRICYYVLWLNTIIKVLYLFGTYRGWLLEVHFLDQMSIWDLALCFILLTQETNIWYRKYPLYEVIHSNWTLMEEIYRKLGSPKHLQDNIIKNDNQLHVMHLLIVFGGCFALMIQFFMSPKYALNTYAIIPDDNFALRCLFASHEYLYMFQCWMNQTFTIVLVEMFAVSYTNIVAEMTLALNQLIEYGEENPSRPPTARDGGSNKLDARVRSEKSAKINGLSKLAKQIKVHKYLDPQNIAAGTKYDIMTLVNDYKRITIAMNQFNSWVGTRMAGTDAASYAQFVSDVFMMIQLLKEPGVDFLGVFFFFEDACAGMIMLFRMLILQSRLMPVAQEFLHSLKSYVQYDTPLKKLLLKTIPSLRTVASKVGGYSVRPSTVPTGINALMNFYITAAMWKRPQDRLT